jgi:hypothetical protein
MHNNHKNRLTVLDMLALILVAGSLLALKYHYVILFGVLGVVSSVGLLRLQFRLWRWLF